MDVQEKTFLTPAQQRMVATWEEHMKHEFETRNTDHTLETMVEGAYVNNVPTLMGGVGLTAVGDFYSKFFIPQMPPDTSIIPVSRTVGHDQIVDEVIFKCTHSIAMDWMLPGVPPTHKPIEIGLVVIVKFRDEMVEHEHIYWDQASVLVQVGLLNGKNLPVAGNETARKILDPASIPSNTLLKRR